MRKGLLAMLAAIAMSACVGAEDSGSGATLKVDLDVVVRSGAVAPVDGLLTAGQPDAAALEVFAREGFKTVIDIRGEREDRGIDEATVIDALGMEYVRFPVTGNDAINFANAKTLNELIHAADGPVLVHCGSANRVGALFALQKSVDGATDEEALAYGREAGMTRLEKRVKEVLSSK